MMKKMELQQSVVYGPVLSRRLGYSFGINLLPVKDKLCSFNCVYCQYGFTGRLVYDDALPEAFLPAGLIIEQVEKALESALKNGIKIDCVTFAGNGEPTLHPEFYAITEAVSGLRDRLFPECGLSILSNSSTLNNPSVIGALKMFDKRIMKLDAGTPEVFYKINHAHKKINYEQMIESLSNLGNIILQTLFIDGVITNSTDEHVLTLISKYIKIRPESIQIYSLDREPAGTGLKKVPADRLNRIKSMIMEKTPIQVLAFD